MLKESITAEGMLLTKQVEYVEEPKFNASAIKENKKQVLVVSDAIGKFQANTVSVNYLTAIISLANAEYNQAVNAGIAAAIKAGTTVDMGTIIPAAYKEVYVTKTIPWKLADNTVATVTIEKLITILDESMTAIGTIVGAK